MNVSLLKVVAIIVMNVVTVFMIIGIGGCKQKRPEQKEKTVGDTWRADDKRLRAEPNIAQPEQSQIQFKQLTEEEQAGAEQLFEMAITSRKMARLPGMSYGQMVDYCRQIIQKYPGSEFDYKARRMLGEVPRDQWDRYKITEQEVNPAK